MSNIVTYSGPPRKEHPLSVEQLYLHGAPVDEVINCFKNRIANVFQIPADILFKPASREKMYVE